jgi:hypothetical protein
MIIGLVALAICMTVAFVVAAPTRIRSNAKAKELRSDHVEQHPTRVTPVDLEWMFGQELPDETTVAVCRLATATKLPNAMLRNWAETHSVTLLALALSAGFGHQDLVATATAGSVIDRESLEMLAELNGGRVGAALARTSRESVTPAA